LVDGEAPTGIGFVSLMKEPSILRCQVTSGSMMHWICSNGFSDPDIILHPIVMSMVDRGPKIRLG
jgi:hypothetical protein